MSREGRWLLCIMRRLFRQRWPTLRTQPALCTLHSPLLHNNRAHCSTEKKVGANNAWAPAAKPLNRGSHRLHHAPQSPQAPTCDKNPFPVAQNEVQAKMLFSIVRWQKSNIISYTCTLSHMSIFHVWSSLNELCKVYTPKMRRFIDWFIGTYHRVDCWWCCWLFSVFSWDIRIY